jgi:hypothetical protein
MFEPGGDDAVSGDLGVGISHSVACRDQVEQRLDPTQFSAEIGGEVALGQAVLLCRWRRVRLVAPGGR